MEKNKKYKLAIAHRVYAGLADQPYCFDDKFKMVQINLNSILESIKDIDTYFFVIFDGCPSSYIDFYKKQTNKEVYSNIDFEYIEVSKIGNHASFGKQIEILLNNREVSEYSYFSEDDYYYKTESFKAMIDFMDNNKDADFVTPLDHPDRYTHRVAESIKTEARVNKYCHWRQVGTTCCTFMVRSSIIKSVERQLLVYTVGLGDGPLWQGLTKDALFSPHFIFPHAFKNRKSNKRFVKAYGERGDNMVLQTWRTLKLSIFRYKKRKLWGPMPSLAIHICDPSISPCCEEFLDKLVEEMKKLE